MEEKYFKHIEDRWPEPFALIDEIAGQMIARQFKLTDPYLKDVVMENLINAVIDIRIDLAARLTDAVDMGAGERDGAGSPDADAL